MPHPTYSHDDRMASLILAPNSVYRLFARPPPEPELATEPKSLDFLFLIHGFHMGCMPSGRITRNAQLYDCLVVAFGRLTSQLQNFLTQSFYDYYVLGENEGIGGNIEPVIELYKYYNIPGQYPFSNFIFRIYMAVAIVAQFPIPRIQRTGMWTLPLEMIEEIALHLPRASILRLARVNSACRNALRHHFDRNVAFTVYYDHSTHHGKSWSARRFIDVLSAAICSARADCTSSILAMLRQRELSAQVQTASFENQWETLFPLHTYICPPEPLDNEEYRELYTTIGWVLHHCPIKHLRLVGLGLPQRLAFQIARNLTLTRLTLETVILDESIIMSPDYRLRCAQITFLTIGFGGTPRSNGMECWSVVMFCGNLRQLFVYAVDNNDFIHFPGGKAYRSMPHIHSLRKLHLQGTSPQLRFLAKWIRWAGENHPNHIVGQITHFKIQAVAGICYADMYPLLEALADYHTVRVLALEGLVATTASIRYIADRFHGLEGLTILRYVHYTQRTARLCPWDSVPTEIAAILGRLPLLEHFAANFAYNRYSFGPAAFHPSLFPVDDRPLRVTTHFEDTLDRVIFEHLSSPSSSTDHSAACKALIHRRNVEDGLSDGASIARVFAAYCASLSSFAIKTDITAFSCHVARSGSSLTLFDVVDHDSPGGFEAWSPLHDHTWEWTD